MGGVVVSTGLVNYGLSCRKAPASRPLRWAASRHESSRLAAGPPRAMPERSHDEALSVDDPWPTDPTLHLARGPLRRGPLVRALARSTAALDRFHGSRR